MSVREGPKPQPPARAAMRDAMFEGVCEVGRRGGR